MTPATRSVAIAGSAALMFGLTACGGDADAKAPAPPLPAAAAKKTEDGGKAFIGHYIDLINHAFSADDTNPLAIASAPECRGCRELVGNLVYANAYGGHRGGELKLTKVEQVGHNGDLYGYVIHYDKAKYEELGDGDTVLFSKPAAKNQKATLIAQWKNGAWRVGDMKIFVTLEKKKEKNEKE